MQKIFIGVASCFLFSCATVHDDKIFLGADEFVSDSYKIKSELAFDGSIDGSVVFVSVTGRKQKISAPAGGLSLKTVLSDESDKNCDFEVKIIRNHKNYRFNYEWIAGLPESSVLLITGDVVYVLRKPVNKILTSWFYRGKKNKDCEKKW